MFFCVYLRYRQFPFFLFCSNNFENYEHYVIPTYTDSLYFKQISYNKKRKKNSV